VDPISHAAIGSAVAGLFPEGTHTAIYWSAVLGAELPDIDIVVQIVRGRVSYLRTHRGPTHGLVTLPLQAALIAGGLKLLNPGAPFASLFGAALLGTLSHVLFDFGNDYGTQGLWPFSLRRIAFDLIPIVDLGILAIIGAGWLASALLPVGRPTVFSGVWLALGLYVLVRFLLHRRAWALVVGHLQPPADCGNAVGCGLGWSVQSVTVHPTLLSLNAWRYVVQQPGGFQTGMVWVCPGRVSPPHRAVNQYDRVVLASLQAATVTAFASWTRRPRVEVSWRDGLWQVRWSDMRYEVDGFSPFTAYAWLDAELNLVDEGLGRRGDAVPERALLLRRLLQEAGRWDPLEH